MTVRAQVQEVGGVLMVKVPEEMRQHLELHSGSEIDLEYGHEALKVHRVLPSFRLQDLLDQCDPNAEISEEDRAWEQMRPVGRELI